METKADDVPFRLTSGPDSAVFVIPPNWYEGSRRLLGFLWFLIVLFPLLASARLLLLGFPIGACSMIGIAGALAFILRREGRKPPTADVVTLRRWRLTVDGRMAFSNGLADVLLGFNASFGIEPFYSRLRLYDPSGPRRGRFLSFGIRPDLRGKFALVAALRSELARLRASDPVAPPCDLTVDYAPRSRETTIAVAAGFAGALGFGIWSAISFAEPTSNEPLTPTGTQAGWILGAVALACLSWGIRGAIRLHRRVTSPRVLVVGADALVLTDPRRLMSESIPYDEVEDLRFDMNLLCIPRALHVCRTGRRPLRLAFDHLPRSAITPVVEALHDAVAARRRRPDRAAVIDPAGAAI